MFIERFEHNTFKNMIIFASTGHCFARAFSAILQGILGLSAHTATRILALFCCLVLAYLTP